MFQLHKNRIISIWGMALLMAAGLFFSASSGLADDSAMKIKEIKEINQPPALGAPALRPEVPVETHYFAKGTVDAVGDKWITINDHQFIIAPNASVGCGVGEFVGIQVDDQVRVVSCERIKK